MACLRPCHRRSTAKGSSHPRRAPNPPQFPPPGLSRACTSPLGLRHQHLGLRPRAHQPYHRQPCRRRPAARSFAPPLCTRQPKLPLRPPGPRQHITRPSGRQNRRCGCGRPPPPPPPPPQPRAAAAPLCRPHRHLSAAAAAVAFIPPWALPAPTWKTGGQAPPSPRSQRSSHSAQCRRLSLCQHHRWWSRAGAATTSPHRQRRLDV